jgi:serine/threonine protein kinase/DNA polymerase III delta prime subunit
VPDSKNDFPSELLSTFYPVVGQPEIGGTAQVWKAIRGVDEVFAAIKILPSINEVGNGKAESHFRREVAALERLEHPSVVTLLGSGVLSDGRPYIATEWVRFSLMDHLQSTAQEGNPAISVINSIVDALAYAYSMGVVHRDLKPSNVRVNEDGLPIIIDFGIAKFIDKTLNAAVTVAEYGTAAYSPPDIERTSAPVRDVYGLAALLLTVFSKREFFNHSMALEALEKLPYAATKALLSDAMSLDNISRRPQNVEAFRDLLHHVLYEDGLDIPVFKKIYVSCRNLNSSAAEEIKKSYDLKNLEEAILADFKDGMTVAIDNSTSLADLDSERYFLVGNRFSFKASSKASGYLDLVFAVNAEGKTGEKLRDKSPFLPNYRPSFETQSSEQVRTMSYLEFKSIFSMEQSKIRDAEEDEQARELFDLWFKMLDARSAWLENKSSKIAYRGASVTGGTVRLEIDGRPSQSFLGTTVVITSLAGSRPISGEVVDVTEEEIVVTLQSGRRGAHQVPTEGGYVSLDMSRNEAPIRKEREALVAVQQGSPKVENTKLRLLVTQPERASFGPMVERTDWLSRNLDDQKRDAVSSALSSEEIFLLQGPPGTGKTTFIAETVGQFLKENPEAKILIASQTHAAVDNALERIEELLPDVPMCRLIGISQENRVSQDASHLTLSRRLEQWAKQTRERSQIEFEQMCRNLNADLQWIEVALLVLSLRGLAEKIESLEGELLGLTESEDGEMPSDDSSSQILNFELTDDLSIARKSLDQTFDALDISVKDRFGLSRDSSSQAFAEAASELFPVDEIEAKKVRSLIALINDWHQHLERPEEFEDVVLNTSRVIGATCIGIARKAFVNLRFDLVIIDEASKSLPTEAMVAMIRGRKWILVGDDKQLPPMVEESLRDRDTRDRMGIDLESAETSLFSMLVERLPSDNQFMLTDQYRMTDAIGGLISECFYGGKLISKGPAPLTGLNESLSSPVMWLDTSELADRHEKLVGSHSYINRCEANVIESFLIALDQDLRAEDISSIDVLLLAPYGPQIRELQILRDKIAAITTRLNISVSSVDASQGRESDIVIFSITTSNPQGRIGFLHDSPRVNVALSRARLGLVVVGDWSFWSQRPGLPLGKVSSYIEKDDGEYTERRVLKDE